MEYDLIKAIEEVIEHCMLFGSGRVQRKDNKGNVILWLEAEWVDYGDGIHDVIELEFCFNDTGRVAYSKFIEETKMNKW